MVMNSVALGFNHVLSVAVFLPLKVPFIAINFLC